MDPEADFNDGKILNDININKTIIEKMAAYSKHSVILPVEDIVNGMLDWVRVIDLQGNIIYTNKAMEEGLKCPVIGKKCYEAFGKSEPCVNCISLQSIFDGKTHTKDEIFNEMYFSVKSSPIKDKNGEVIAIVEVLRDITNEKLLQQKIIDQNNQHKDDIEMAKKIQISFLPAIPPHDKVDFSFIYNPSEQLGGDFLDIFFIDEDHLGLYIADVAGHGITASLLTVYLRSTFNKTTLSPSNALTELFNEFSAVGFDASLYITVLYSIIDLKNSTITYSNAGHSICPIVFSDTKFEILRSAGLPICNWLDKASYTEKTRKLFKQERIFFCTDGIIEARNNAGELFGEERLLTILTTGKDCPDVVLKDIINQVHKFTGVEKINFFADDITMALLEIK